ncbi:hypothetical protein FRC20_005506 [Serendipita sp. 405]|nr:hypothetical protein FRC16_008852 [Serendipita sp. 398]KAG8867537.1 hypothetical protein FRC20_005506 [Serendipita sp. 405]
MRPHTFLLLSYLLLSGIRGSPLPSSHGSGSPVPATNDGGQRPKRTPKEPARTPTLLSDAAKEAEQKKRGNLLGVSKSGRGSAKSSRGGTPMLTPLMDVSREPASIFGGAGSNGRKIEDALEDKKYADRIIVQRKDVPQIEKSLKSRVTKFFAEMQGILVTDEDIDKEQLPPIDPGSNLPAELGLNDVFRAGLLTMKGGVSEKMTKEHIRGADGKWVFTVPGENEGDPSIDVVFIWQGKVMKNNQVNFLYLSKTEAEEAAREGEAEEGAAKDGEEGKANTGSKAGSSKGRGDPKAGASAGKSSGSGSGSGSESSGVRAATAASSARQKPPVGKATGAGAGKGQSRSKDKSNKGAVAVKGKAKATGALTPAEAVDASADKDKPKGKTLQGEILRKYVDEERMKYGSNVRVIAGYVVFSYEFGVQIVPLHKVAKYWNTKKAFQKCIENRSAVEAQMTKELLQGKDQEDFMKVLMDLKSSDPLVAGVENLRISDSSAGRGTPLSTHGTNSPAPGAQPLPGTGGART